MILPQTVTPKKFYREALQYVEKIDAKYRLIRGLPFLQWCQARTRRAQAVYSSIPGAVDQQENQKMRVLHPL